MKKTVVLILVLIIALGSAFLMFRNLRRSVKQAAKTERGVAQNNDPKSLESSRSGCVFSGFTRNTYAYKAVADVDPNFLSLDVYVPKPTASCNEQYPIMMYVHGGGWQQGDKANKIQDKVNYFTGRGYVFVSVNYRLVPAIVYPAFNQDVAAAVRFIYDNAGSYNGDRSKISIMGHSAGGGIISSVATDESYLNEVGLPLNTLRCAVSLDTEGYDISVKGPAEDAAFRAGKNIYTDAFGNDPEVWKKASPINHISQGKGIPSFFVVTRGSKIRVELANKFSETLKGVGVYAEIMETPKLDHEGVNAAVGTDNLITPRLQTFLTAHCN